MDTVEPLAPERHLGAGHPRVVPDAIARAQGAWIRCGLAVGDGPLREMSDVLWLQVGDYFADLRVPRRAPEGGRALGGNVMLNALNAPRAFSGTVRGHGDRLVWSHDLDTMAVVPDRNDGAVVLQFADLLVEAGAGYVERWQAAASGEGPAGTVHERRNLDSGLVDARMLCLGDDAVAVWAVPARGGARLRRRGGGTWLVDARVGAQALSVEVATELPGRTELARVLDDPGAGLRSGRDGSAWAVVASP
jgi:hypothetical protein